MQSMLLMPLMRSTPPFWMLDSLSIGARRIWRRRILTPPPLCRQGPNARPYLIERVAVVEPAVLHHVPDAICVPDVLERIPVEHLQVRELPDLEGTEIL